MMGVSQYSVVWFTTLIAIEQAGQISPLLEPTDQFPCKLIVEVLSALSKCWSLRFYYAPLGECADHA
jgi:hypothetical protein